jgi:hypothetical protein
MTTIYLSSTYEDLKEYRRVVYDALRKSGHHVTAMEDYVAVDQRPVDKCLKDVTDADIYVGIFAFRYGYVPPLGHNNPNGLSVTELEFRQAETLKKPCLIFIAKEDCSIPLQMADAYTGDGERGARIKRFRQYLLTEKIASSFSSPYELSTLVLAAIAKYHKESNIAEQSDRQQIGTAPEITWDINKDGSPYPGLMHFSRKYAPVFFGRDAEVVEVLDRQRLPEGRFLIISAGSGTGKSSLVDAGVLPRIEETEIGEERRYVCVRMVPSQGSHPFDALLRPLHGYAERAGLSVYELAEKTAAHPDILPEKIHEIISKGLNGNGLVLFLDQMEELFTTPYLDLSKQFLMALYEAVQKCALRVLATIRSDFLHHCHNHDALLQVLRGGGHYPLGRLEPYMLPEVIVKPAQCAGITIPDALIRRLVREFGSEQHSLPLLAFALERLFTERSNNSLSEAAYNDMGGIAGAISTHVNIVEDRISEQFGAGAKSLLPEIFQLLVSVNIDGQPTRQRKLKGKFADHLQPIVDLLSKERLLTTEGDGAESTVYVSHEELFEAWPGLSRWIAENRDDLFILRQAEIEAKEWNKHNYDSKYLWHIDRLQRLGDIRRRVGGQAIDAVGEYAAPQNRLIERLCLNSLSHEERLTIGIYLSVLGDNRRGVGIAAGGIPDIEWIDIPYGQVKLKDIPGGLEVKPFRIAKYPVTNAQFDTFIKAEDGYQNAQWWEGIIESNQSVASKWEESNSPRETVSWYEAVAFCRWLSNRMRAKVRLPTEWEWQFAASGELWEHRYPWDGEWDPSKCNTYESKLNRSSAVGMYPSGATRQGVLDMVGNVWEWCLNKYERAGTSESLLIDKDVSSRRAVRGGSWNTRPPDSPSSLQPENKIPSVRDSEIGFRLAQDIE